MVSAGRLVLIPILFGALTSVGCDIFGAHDPAPRRDQAALTFNKDIAPILFEHCASCHHRGQPAPFALIDYDSVRQHARQIAAATQSRFMPPWLPEPGYGEFVNARRLRDDQIQAVQRWLSGGAVEGDPSDLPQVPKWIDGWQLGTPDLIVQLSRPYTLQADGTDVFRNFVLPVATPSTRYVRAVEFRPGNPRIVHHAVINIDPTRSSR